MKTQKHPASQFPWGKVIQNFSYDFDNGVGCRIVSFHPWIYERGCSTHKPDMEKVEYYCEEINQSSDNLLTLLLAWIVHRQLGGGNQDALIQGIARMLKFGE